MSLYLRVGGLIALLTVSVVFPDILLGIIVLCCTVMALLWLLKLLSLITSRVDEQRPQGVLHNKPFVSVHIACCNEPAELLKQSLEYLSRLDYPHFEVLVIHNNNKDIVNWHRIRDICKRLGPRFRFFHQDYIEGYKAGALNYLRKYMAKGAELLAIVDADYHVAPDFLARCVSYFADPKVAIVQSPQDYRDVTVANRGLFFEYRNFFSIIMNQAEHFDAVTFTGTMGIMRTNLFTDYNVRWNEACITEDTEAGMQIHALGMRGVYLDTGFGQGLMPQDYGSLAAQRQRWTYGNMQVIAKNLALLTYKKGLSVRQRLSFVTQLTAWMHLDLIIAALYVLAALAYSLHGGRMLFLSLTLLLAGLIASSLANLVFFIFGLVRMKEATVVDALRMYMTHTGLLGTMTSSWLLCLAGRPLRFKVTNKNAHQINRSVRTYVIELLLPLLLLIVLVMRSLQHAGLGELAVLTILIFVQLFSVYYVGRQFRN